ncbi:EamA family transporter RarD [Thauera sp. Sel9]|uniref:EamA family transporter RarD n=1 Tax=Thauera sp. Sel9 TaxID=2974299 RepID=UPI0021E1286F|nr:EamA family transporter RarD [Thauera sp. Sel9]MCV2217146.1 EamA family transporter RarD [Thauera sp. Sel9]
MIKGLAASITASVLFGVLYYLAPLLVPLDGEQIFGWRMLCTMPFTTMLLFSKGQWPLVQQLALRVRRQPLLALGLVGSSALLGIQLWLFLWAPLHGRALPVSLGYFLLPLVMVLTGRVLYRERLSLLQWLATALATVGVTHEVVRTGGMPWETWLVALGYTAYFVLRRRMNTHHLGGHWLDMLLLVPAASWFVLRTPSSLPLMADNAHLWALMPAVGMVSAVSLALYMAANRLLPLGLFGLLGYVEPVLLAMVALLLGESIGAAQWPTYGPIFAAVAVLMIDGTLQLRQHGQRPVPV